MWKPGKPLIFGLFAAFLRQHPRKEIFGRIVEPVFNNFPQINSAVNNYYKAVHILPLAIILFYVEACEKRERFFALSLLYRKLFGACLHPKSALSVADIFDGVVHQLLDFAVLFDLLLHLLQRVDDGGVMSAAERLADVDHRKRGDLPCNIDSDMARVADIGALVFL